MWSQRKSNFKYNLNKSEKKHIKLCVFLILLKLIVIKNKRLIQYIEMN